MDMHPYIDRAFKLGASFHTYLTIFTYGFQTDGTLVVPEGDEELIGISPFIRCCSGYASFDVNRGRRFFKTSCQARFLTMRRHVKT